MKKRTYRAIALSNVDIEKLRDQVAARRLIVGIDAAKTNFVATLTHDGREPLTTVKWEHPRQTREFVALLASTCAAKVEAAIESTGTYGDPVVELLRRSGFDVFRVSAKRVHDAAEIFDGVPSQHDAKCASIIARLHSDGISSPWTQVSEEVRNLKAATRTAARAHDLRQRLLSELEGWLAKFWPEILTLLELGGASELALLREYGSPSGAANERTAAEALMRRTSGPILATSKIHAVLDSAEMTVGVPMTDGEMAAMRELANQIDAINKKIREDDGGVKRLVASNETATRIAQVVGAVTAAVLVSEAGDPNNYPSTSAYVKALGLNLKERSSGQKKGQLGITKRGSSKARQYLCLAAWRQVQTDPIARAYHQAKIERDGGRVRMKGVVAIMRKLARALWHVARGSVYDASKLFDVRCLTNGSAGAAA